MKKVAKSKKHPTAEDAGNVVEKEKKEKASSQPKKMGNEIDEIFAKKTQKRLEKEKASSQPKTMGSDIDEIFAEKKRKRLEKEKASSQPRKMGSEIDEIFAEKKRKRLENEKKAEGGKPTKALEKQKGKSSKSRNSFREHSSSVGTSQWRKKTVDGLTVYTEEELGLGKPDAGGTGLCPFDCNCCF